MPEKNIFGFNAGSWEQTKSYDVLTFLCGSNITNSARKVNVSIKTFDNYARENKYDRQKRLSFVCNCKFLIFI